MYNSTKAKWNSHAVRWCTSHTTFGVSMERVFGVTIRRVVSSLSMVPVAQASLSPGTHSVILTGEEISLSFVTSSGIVALVLIGGRTSHAIFKIPIQIHEGSLWDIKRGSDRAVIDTGLSIILPDISAIFPTILHLSLSLLPNMVRLLPYWFQAHVRRSGEQRSSWS